MDRLRKGEEKARYQKKNNCLMAIFDPPNGDNIATRTVSGVCHWHKGINGPRQ